MSVGDFARIKSSVAFIDQFHSPYGMSDWMLNKNFMKIFNSVYTG